MIHAPMQSLAEDVYTIRKALDISQNELARRAHVHESILSKLIRGVAVAGPSEKKVRAYLARQRRVLVAREIATWRAARCAVDGAHEAG